MSNNPKTGNLNDKIQQLESIVGWFDQDDIDLDQAISQFEKGAQLAKQIQAELTSLKTKITVLKQRFND